MRLLRAATLALGMCAWAPSLGADPVEGSAATPDADVEVASYTLRATLDPSAHTVRGEGTIRWRNTARVPARDLWFHLYLNGFEHERTVFLRSTGGEHRGNDRGRLGRIDVHTLRTAAGDDLLAQATHDPEVTDDRSQLHVTLPQEVAPGGTLELAMTWTSVLPEAFARTGFRDSFHMVAQWFPKLAVREDDGRWAHFAFHGNSEFYADFGRYDVTLTVPPRYVVGATGLRTLVERTPQGDHYRYLAAPVHDFAWVAWDHFHERRATAGDVDLRVLFPPGYDHAAALTVDTLQRGMPEYAARFGPYPYPNLTVVLPPEEAEGAGGMEYPTLITTGAAWWMPDGVRATEYVTLHEFMHQYFYGLVASNENAWPFLDEGFTEYATALGLEALHPRAGSLVDLGPLGVHFDVFAFESLSSASIRHLLPVASAAPAFPTFGSYGAHVYPRTATVLRTCERRVGATAFRRAMRAYATRWRFRHPTPDDFFAVMRDELGDAAVDELLRPALLAPLTLDYAVTHASSQRVGDRHVGRVVVQRTGSLSLPVEVELEDTRGARRIVTWDGRGPLAELRYEGAAPLRAARVDPHHLVPLDSDTLDDARLASDAPRRSSLPAVARVAYWIGLALEALGP